MNDADLEFLNQPDTRHVRVAIELLRISHTGRAIDIGDIRHAISMAAELLRAPDERIQREQALARSQRDALGFARETSGDRYVPIV